MRRKTKETQTNGNRSSTWGQNGQISAFAIRAEPLRHGERIRAGTQGSECKQARVYRAEICPASALLQPQLTWDTLGKAGKNNLLHPQQLKPRGKAGTGEEQAAPAAVTQPGQSLLPHTWMELTAGISIIILKKGLEPMLIEQERGINKFFFSWFGRVFSYCTGYEQTEGQTHTQPLQPQATFSWRIYAMKLMWSYWRAAKTSFSVLPT